MKLFHANWALARERVMPLRFAVFVEEQGVPVDIEIDEYDPVSTHAWLENEAGEVLATGRLLPDGHIGRMAVDVSYRRRGLGAAVLQHLMHIAQARGMRHLALHAQTSAQGFYARYGFQPQGPVFMEAGIAHQLMIRDSP